MEMYYTNSTAEDATYGENNEYPIEGHYETYRGDEYGVAEEFNVTGESSVDTSHGKHMSLIGSSEYYQPQVSESSDYYTGSSSLSFVDESLLNAQERLGSWKSVGIHATGASSLLSGGNVASSNSISNEECSQMGFNRNLPSGDGAHFNYCAVGQSESSYSVPPGPRVSAGIRTFQPRGAQFQRPAAPQIPRSVAAQFPRFPAPVHPERVSHALYSEDNATDEWMDSDAYCSSNNTEWDTCNSNDVQEQGSFENDFQESEFHSGLSRSQEDLSFDNRCMSLRAPRPFRPNRGNRGFGSSAGSNRMDGQALLETPRGVLINKQGPRGAGRGNASSNSGFMMHTHAHFRPATLNPPSRSAGPLVRQPAHSRMDYSVKSRGPSAVSVRPRFPPVTNKHKDMQSDYSTSQMEDSLRPYPLADLLEQHQPNNQAGYFGPRQVVEKPALRPCVPSLLDVKVTPSILKKPTAPAPVNLLSVESNRSSADDSEQVIDHETEGQPKDIYNKINMRDVELLHTLPPPPPPPIEPTAEVTGSYESDKVKSSTSANQDEGADDNGTDEELDTSKCEICDIKFEKEQAYHIHIRSTSHHQKLMEHNKKANSNSESAPEASTLCGTSSGPEKAVVNEKAMQGAQPLATESTKGANYCHVCCFEFASSEVFNSHLLGLVHRQKLEAQKKGSLKVSAVETNVGRYEEDPKNKTKGDAKPITADDFDGAEQFKFSVAPFTCTVCDIQCTGERSYEMHVSGAKHLKKLKKMNDKGIFERNEDPAMHTMPVRRRGFVSIQDEIDRCPEPLIGLDYVTEYQTEDSSVEPCYICDLCQAKMDPRQVISHITGIKHRLKYFKFYGEGEHLILWDCGRKADRIKLAAKFAAGYQRREGRLNIRMKVLKTPFSGEAGGVGVDRPFWKENDDTRTRSSEPPGFSTMAEINARYRPVKDEEEDDDDDERSPPPRDRMRFSPPKSAFPIMPPRDPMRFEERFEGPPLRRPPAYRPLHDPAVYPPMHDPFRPSGFREEDLYPPHPNFGHHLPEYSFKDRSFYDRPPFDPGRSNLDYHNRFGHDGRDSFGIPRRSIGADYDSRPIISRPVVVDYNHGAPSDSQPSTDHSSANRDQKWSRELDEDRRSLERDRVWSTDYGRDPTSVVSSGRQRSIERSLDRKSHQYATEHSFVDSKHPWSLEQSGRGTSAERDSQLKDRDRVGSLAVRDDVSLSEFDRDKSSSEIDFDVGFMKNAIAQCNINTEADAEIALQISNCLTQGLLEYRLCALHRLGKSDPALEQHLDDLRRQNAELDATGSTSSSAGCGEMCIALSAAKRLASILGSGGGGGQELVQQAMSVLDAVNKQLYGILDSCAASPSAAVESKSSDNLEVHNVSKRRSSAERDEYRDRNKPPRSQESDDNYLTDRNANDHQDRASSSDTGAQSTSPLKRSSAAESQTDKSSVSLRPAASKRFRFGL